MTGQNNASSCFGCVMADTLLLFFNVGGLFDEEVAKMLKEHSCRGSHSYFSTAKYVAYGFCSV